MKTWQQEVDWTGKRCTSSSLERIIRRSRFKNLGELHKDCRRDILRKVTSGHSCQKHLTWAKERRKWTAAYFRWSTFSIKVRETGRRLERHRCLNSSVNFLESVMMRGASCYWWLVHWVSSSPKSTQDILELHLLLRGFMEILISFSGIKLSICPQCQNDYQMFFLTILLLLWLANQLTWPELQREFVGSSRSEDEKHQTQKGTQAKSCCQKHLSNFD